MRTNELGELTGYDMATITSALRHPREKGLVTRCKVQSACGAIAYEYRIGPGIPSKVDAPELTQKSTTLGKPSARQQPKALIPYQAPVKQNAQPAVAKSNTGSNPQARTPPAAVAVAATAKAKATPEPKAKVLGSGPASRKAPAGNDDILGRVQAMHDDEFADFVSFLIRVRSWSRSA